MTVFRLLLGIDVLAAAVLLVFFVWGLADGSVSSFNIGLWLATLAAPAAVIIAALALRARDHARAASGVLMLVAIPAALSGALFVLLLVLPGRWN